RALASVVSLRRERLRARAGARLLRCRRAEAVLDLRGPVRARRLARHVADRRRRCRWSRPARAPPPARGARVRGGDALLRAPQLQLLPAVRRLLTRTALPDPGASLPR